jgi:hypothetical protein
MLTFQTSQARNQLAKWFFVSFISGDLSPAKPACPSPPQHPIPAHPTVLILATMLASPKILVQSPNAIGE